MRNYDLIVIGSGPAGQRAAIQAAKCGRRVAVIEAREIVGGACINTGTIPSKTMREAVMHLSGFQFQGIYGINYHVKEKITMADLGFRVNQVIKTEVGRHPGAAGAQWRGSDHRARPASSIPPTSAWRIRAARRISKPPSSSSPPAPSRPISPTVPLNGRTIINSDQILHDAARFRRR